jgi:hypothetical protein
MPQSKPHVEPAIPREPDDKWEVRALSLAVRLDHAAEELRRLVDEYRESRKDKSNA